VKPYLLILVLLCLTACSNQFEIKSKKWHLVGQSYEQNPRKVFIDSNRVRNEDGYYKTIVRELFDEVKMIELGSKPGKQARVIPTKSIETRVWYKCSDATVRIISYQYYNEEGRVAYNAWIRDPITQSIRKRIADKKAFDYFCN